MKFITRLLEPTLSGALASLTSAINKLDRVADLAFEEAAAHKQAAAIAAAKAEDAGVEAVRAVRISERLKELVA